MQHSKCLKKECVKAGSKEEGGGTPPSPPQEKRSRGAGRRNVWVTMSPDLQQAGSRGGERGEECFGHRVWQDVTSTHPTMRKRRRRSISV